MGTINQKNWTNEWIKWIIKKNNEIIKINWVMITMKASRVGSQQVGVFCVLIISNYGF